MDLLLAVLPLAQIALSALLVAGVLLQRSEAGLGSAFGGEIGGAYHTRRGFEKTLFNGTIVLGVLFAITSLAALILR